MRGIAAIAIVSVALVACGEDGQSSGSSDVVEPAELPQLSEYEGSNPDYVERIRALAVACFRADGHPMAHPDQWNRKAENPALPRAIIAALNSASDAHEFSSLLDALVNIGTSDAHEALFLFAMEAFADEKTDVAKVREICNYLGKCGVFGLAALTSSVGARAIRRADEGWFIDPWHGIFVANASNTSEAHSSALMYLMHLAMDPHATDTEKAAALATLNVLWRRQPIGKRSFRIEKSLTINIAAHHWISLADNRVNTSLVQHMMQIQWHHESGTTFVMYRLNDAEIDTLKARYLDLLSEVPNQDDGAEGVDDKHDD